MELPYILIIFVTTSAGAKSLMQKRSNNRMEKPGSNEKTDIYNDNLYTDDTLFNINDDILCSFDGEYPDTEFQMPTEDPNIIAIVNDLKSNIEFAISDMTSSIEGHTEVLQEIVEYVFDNALKVLNNAILNFTHEPNYELLAETYTETEKVEIDSLKYIAEHLLPSMDKVKSNITSNISQATDQVTKYVYEVTSSIMQESNQIVEFFISFNDVGRLEEISGQNVQSEKAFDTASLNWDPTILSIAQENIEIVFSYVQEAVEIGTNLLHACLDESVLAVSENIVNLENSRDTNKAIYILDTIFRDQIISIQGLLTEAVSTALIAIVKTLLNFEAAIEVEILVGAELVSGSLFD